MRHGDERRTELDQREVHRGQRPGDRFVRVIQNPKFLRTGRGILTVTPRAEEPTTFTGRAWDRIKRILIGAPLASDRAAHERLTKLKALAVLSSDALSSVAYAPEEILRALLLAGVAALSFSLPIAGAIVALMVIVGFSYSQTIRAYPNGGGSYSVASENLGTLAGLTAGAALMVGYVLTVAVSVAAGVAAIISAIPSLDRWRIELGVAFILFVTLANLRGVRESGTIFSVPTYVFVISMYGLIGFGLYKVLTGDLPATPPIGEAATGAGQAVTLFLLLRAFAAGCAAMTGTEAISNGVPAFQPPEWKNARTTLVAMVALLGSMFFGLTYLVDRFHVIPQETGDQTVISMLARAVLGSADWAYYVIQASTALILILAANTAFADFPRLSSIMARDRFIPHQFEFRGDRLAFSNGILVLGAICMALLAAFGGDTHALIPLYAVGVFLAFTMSQSGMVLHWWRLRERGWRRSMIINAVGAVTTAIVTLVVAAVRFREGAWIVVVILPLLVLLFKAIHRHYVKATEELNPETPLTAPQIRHNIIVPVASLNRVALQTLAYARSISPNVTAVHVSTSHEDTEEVQRDWEEAERLHGDLGSLVVIESPYRSLVGPLLAYIDEVDRRDPNDTLTVVLPEFVARHWWEHLLHNQTALRLKAQLLFRPGTVVASVPYHLKG